MKNNIFKYSIAGLVFFLLLVFYNYYRAQSALKNTRPAPLSIDLVSYPAGVTVGGQATFIWKVVATPDKQADYTTIYWGYESTPSALSRTDSPQAVGYPNSQSEYIGTFPLPEDFDTRIMFGQPGRVYFRAYAKVGQDYLWNEENYFDVQ